MLTHEEAWKLFCEKSGIPNPKLQTLVERHIIKPTHKFYNLLDDFCFKSKNLYNAALYVQRQFYFEQGTFLSHNELNYIMRDRENNIDYKNLPAQTSNRILDLLCKNLKSFQRATKEYFKNPDKFTGKPKLPKYLHKEKGRNILILGNRQCRVKDSIVYLPKVFNRLTIKTKIVGYFQQLRILPRGNHIILELVYQKEIPELRQSNGNFLSIDMGLDNLLTMCSNVENSIPYIINGKGLKSYNKDFNKKLAHYKSIAMKCNGKHSTKRIEKLYYKRNRVIENFTHHASKFVVDYAEQLNVTDIIIGNNKDWKRYSKLSKKVNQTFVQIPYNSIINKIKYKADQKGINVHVVEESFTSGTSFLDNEYPDRNNYNISRRIHRGLFKSNNNIYINADLNASFQIAKKVFPDMYLDGISGLVLNPTRVNLLKLVS